jgi:altronate dehydratase large subunit
MQFMGYARPDGRVGVRNHVVILSTVLCSATEARMIAQATGAVAITHEGGCMEVGPEKAHTRRILMSVASHPNVGGVLVVGLGCEQVAAQTLARATTGRPVRYLNIQEAGGTTAAVRYGIEAAHELMEQVAEDERRPTHIRELVLATQCGGSDTGSGLASNPVLGVVSDRLIALGGTVLLGETGGLYGAAGLLSKRAVSPQVGRRIVEITDAVERHYGRMGKSIKEANPSPGNIAGGLTTLVEKSLGGVRKGGTTPIQGVLGPAEPVMGKGLWVMDTSLGADSHATSDLVAGGAQILAFTTGRGNPVGSPIAPVIKITASQETVETMGENIDFDASPVLRGEESLEECGQRLFAEFLAVGNGQLTKAEQLAHCEFAIGKIAVG